MSNQKFTLDFGILRTGFLVTIILGIFKVSNVADINLWWVFMPLIVAVGILVLSVFIIGLITVYLLSTQGVDIPEDDSEEGEE